MTEKLELKDSKGQNFKGYAVGKGDFPELEGRIIDYVYSDGQTFSVAVVGVNRAVGVTLVSAKDKDDYFMCIQGPALPGNGHLEDYYDYDLMFDELVEMIASGTLYMEKHIIHDSVGKTGNPFGPSGGTCAFSQ